MTKRTISGKESSSWAPAALALSTSLSSLGTSIVNVGLPTLQEAFAATFQQVQWIVLAYLVSVTALIVGVGRLGDMFGRRRLLLGGILLFTAASALCGAAPSLWILIAGRAAQGLGAAAMMALSLALVAGSVPKEKTGSAMGLLATMSAVGTALGPMLGGLLIAGFGWRAIFFVNLPMGLAALALAWGALPLDNPAAKAVRGRLGSFGMLRDPVLSAGLVMNVLVMTVMMATLVVGPFYLSHGLDLTTSSVALTMSAGPVVAAVAGVPAGRLVDRLGGARASILGLAVTATGCVGLAASSGIAGYVGALVTVTAGYALFQAANNALVMTRVGAGERGLASGLLNLSRNLGLVAGASAMGALFAFGTGGADIAAAPSAAIVSGMRLCFSVAVALMLAALVIAAASGKARSVTARDLAATKGS